MKLHSLLNQRTLIFGVFAASLLTFAGCAGSDNGGFGGNGGGNGGNGGNGGGPGYIFAGAFGSSATLSEPDALTEDKSGNIYVANYAVDNGGVPNVTKFNAVGTKVLTIGNTGTTATGLLAGPQGVAVDSSGNIYVADANNFRICKYSPTGTFIAALLQNQCGYPYQINIDSNGNLYVACSVTQTSGITNQHSVVEFSPTGTIINVIGASALQDADGVALDNANNVYVSDYGAKAIVVFNTSGTSLGSFGNTGQYPLMGPQGLYVDQATGTIFVADLNANDVAYYDSSGNLVGFIGDSSGSGALSKPYDVFEQVSGNIMVADEGNNRVAVFTYSQTTKARKTRSLTRLSARKAIGHH